LFAGECSIINISVAVTVRPRADELPCAAAKACLNALTAGLAKAFRPTVSCNAIMAATLTDMSNAWGAARWSGRIRTRGR
jgi:NAD(P)-dependent dehydrogenase (short-subunit alcohol dehydrogenase family)